MSEEDQTVDVTALPKFDMPSYESKMTAKDVKSLSLRHGIPLDLHPVALTEGWTMDKLPDDMIESRQGCRWSDFPKTYSGLKGWKQRFSFLDKRAIPDAMAWRHHDSDINDHVPKDGFSMQVVEALTERVIDPRPVPSSLLFQGGLATTWDYPVVTMSEYLRFLLLSGASISKGPAFTSQDCIPHHTTCPLPEGQNIPEKTGHQRRVEVEDPKIVATRERKARAVAKLWERKKQGSDGGEGSRPKTKRRKTTGRSDEPVAYEATSSPEPLRTLNPQQPSGALAATAESRENCSPSASPRDSGNHSVHNYSDDHRDKETDDLNLGSFGEQSGRALSLVNTEVIKPSLACQRANWGPTADRVVTPLRTATQGAKAAKGESSREGALMCRGDPFIVDVALKNEHEGCAGKLKGLENRNREMSQANKDQVLQINELEAALAQKDSALVYAERINADQAQEKERLVSQVGRAEMEKFDCIRKLLPTVVKRLLQSHEYKRSLSEPFNLAIQVGWGKGLAEERSEEDLLKLMGRIEGFDVHTDTKICVEYDKLFERRYPYVEKISRGFCHSVSDLLKVYLDSPPRKQVPPHKPSSKKAPSTFAPPGS
uniref:Transposase (Putative), gypsy type n=1 Tax=Tanacetum cinerariifolium TaxID=118510 RepID=A0A6L2KKF2_TANCI|nr:hypothetical protein [Tanacetum cinerariifolium]